jgi:hypothetical protein
VTTTLTLAVVNIPRSSFASDKDSPSVISNNALSVLAPSNVFPLAPSGSVYTVVPSPYALKIQHPLDLVAVHPYRRFKPPPPIFPSRSPDTRFAVNAYPADPPELISSSDDDDGGYSHGSHPTPPLLVPSESATPPTRLRHSGETSWSPVRHYFRRAHRHL